MFGNCPQIEIRIPDMENIFSQDTVLTELKSRSDFRERIFLLAGLRRFRSLDNIWVTHPALDTPFLFEPHTTDEMFMDEIRYRLYNRSQPLHLSRR